MICLVKHTLIDANLVGTQQIHLCLNGFISKFEKFTAWTKAWRSFAGAFNVFWQIPSQKFIRNLNSTIINLHQVYQKFQIQLCVAHGEFISNVSLTMQLSREFHQKFMLNPKQLNRTIFNKYLNAKILKCRKILLKVLRLKDHPSGSTILSKPLFRNSKYRVLRQHLRFEQYWSTRVLRFLRELCNIFTLICMIGWICSGQRSSQVNCVKAFLSCIYLLIT